MSRTPTLENPFAPEKHRSADDPEFVGKILGPEAEAAMRRTVADKVEGADNADQKGDIVLTSEEHAQAEKEKQERSSEWKMEQARKELLAWAKEIGKDEAWALATFTIHSDGSLTVEGNLEIPSYPVKRLPKGLTRIDGTLNLNHTKIVSLEGFPQEIGHDCYLKGTKITSLEGLSQTIGGVLDLSNTTITSLDGLPSPENIGGQIIFSKDVQGTLFREAEAKGYSVRVLPEITGHGYDNEYDNAHSA